MLRKSKLQYVRKIPNFNVWQHFQYIHSKVAVVDNEIVAIGSYNFESYSSEHSYETAVICNDQSLINQITDDLTLDLANSTPMTF